MTLCIILAVTVLFITAFLAMPVRMELRYDGDILSMICNFGPVSLRLLPRPKERKSSASPKRRLSHLLWENGGTAIYQIIGSMHIELLRIRFTAGGPDPYDAAMAYAHMGAAMEALEHFAAGWIEKTELQVDVDFDGGRTVLDGRMRLRARMLHVLRAGFCFGTGCLRGYSQQKHLAKTKG